MDDPSALLKARRPWREIEGEYLGAGVRKRQQFAAVCYALLLEQQPRMEELTELQIKAADLEEELAAQDAHFELEPLALQRQHELARGYDINCIDGPKRRRTAIMTCLPASLTTPPNDQATWPIHLGRQEGMIAQQIISHWLAMTHNVSTLQVCTCDDAAHAQSAMRCVGCEVCECGPVTEAVVV